MKGDLRMRCPECKRKGVTWKSGRFNDDGAQCRYCEFWFYTGGYDTRDILGRAAFIEANEDWPSRSGEGPVWELDEYEQSVVDRERSSPTPPEND